MSSNENSEAYKRIIPCLDVKDGEVVKGIQFKELRQAGDPLVLAEKYQKEGADELVFLDIEASWQQRETSLESVKRIAENIELCLAVGGGVTSLKDMDNIFTAGGDKVSINTAAVKDPSLIEEAAREFGEERIVVAIDAKRDDSGYRVYTSGGQIETELELAFWAKEVRERGAGEILLTSIDQDGGKNGYDVEMTSYTALESRLPVIASGGAGKLEHFYEVFTEGYADGALAASVFHYEKIRIKELKNYLATKGVSIKL